ncbi:VWA domain-containing protein [Streptomyces sp. NBC_00048]|uniref:VWA domain-containing protein n=1 Tax=Streptomyces sp. NBC_00048 TaxID=2975628 RepID=UPI00324B43EF
MTQDPGGSTPPAPAVLYLAGAGRSRFWSLSSRREERECRHRATRRGLSLLDRTARTPQEADDLLRDLPDGVVVAESAITDHDELRKALMSADTLLEGLLGLGATLRLCDVRGTPSPAVDRWSDGTAVLLTVAPFPGLPSADGGRRARECEEYAQRCGLRVGTVIDSRQAHLDFIAKELSRPARGTVPTIVIHPDALALAPDAEGRPGRIGAAGRWLLQGRVIHSALQLRSSRATEDMPRPRAAEPRPWTDPAPEEVPGSERRPAERPHESHQGEELRDEELRDEELRLGGELRHAQELSEERREELYEEMRERRRLVARLKQQRQELEEGQHEAYRRRAASRPSPRAASPAPASGADRWTRSDPQPAPAYGQAQAPAFPARLVRGINLPPLPSRAPGRPLPHDGLFIRRRSAYGTRSVVGVTELIDSGVLIEQDHIRFDDFVAARTDQVPGPPEGEALAVSHGLARVPGDSKAHEDTTHFVEIALKAGAEAQPGVPAKEPLPVNFVFVVDTSSSMAGEKLDTVKSALQEIYERLRPTDSLGIITFATDVSTLLQATRKEELPPERFASTVAGMTAYGGTDIQLGVQYGIAEISRRASAGRTVNRLYLFSDGDPTSGERNWTTVRKNLAARLRGDLTLSCFGFGTDARMAELSALAGTARGHCTFVTRPEQVRSGLLEDLERRDHLAAIDIQLRIDIDPAVTVWHLYGHDLVTDQRVRARVFRESRDAARRAREEYGTEVLPDLITGDKGIRIFAPDLAFGETYWVVLEIQVPEGSVPAGGIGTATVQYVDTVARENRSRDIVLSDAATLAEETVTVHAVGLRTSEITFHALDDLYENDRDAAGQRLTQHIEVLKQVHRTVPAPEFVDDQVTIEKLLALAGTLGTTAAFSDSAVPASAPGIRGMNRFARVRSGFAAF